jgi:hypothetical protein
MDARVRRIEQVLAGKPEGLDRVDEQASLEGALHQCDVEPGRDVNI